MRHGLKSEIDISESLNEVVTNMDLEAAASLSAMHLRVNYNFTKTPGELWL